MVKQRWRRGCRFFPADRDVYATAAQQNHPPYDGLPARREEALEHPSRTLPLIKGEKPRLAHANRKRVPVDPVLIPKF
jgi:hypothetical protein